MQIVKMLNRKDTQNLLLCCVETCTLFEQKGRLRSSPNEVLACGCASMHESNDATLQTHPMGKHPFHSFHLACCICHCCTVRHLLKQADSGTLHAN